MYSGLPIIQSSLCIDLHLGDRLDAVVQKNQKSHVVLETILIKRIYIYIYSGAMTEEIISTSNIDRWAVP